jgi:hypothetical protein
MTVRDAQESAFALRRLLWHACSRRHTGRRCNASKRCALLRFRREIAAYARFSALTATSVCVSERDRVKTQIGDGETYLVGNSTASRQAANVGAL